MILEMAEILNPKPINRESVERKTEEALLEADRLESIKGFESMKKIGMRWDRFVWLIKDIFPDIYQKEDKMVKEASGHGLEHFLSDFINGYEVPKEVKQALITFRNFFRQASAEQMFDSAEQRYQAAMKNSDFARASEIGRIYLGDKWHEEAARKKFKRLYQEMLAAGTNEEKAEAAAIAFGDAFYGNRWDIASKKEWRMVLEALINNWPAERPEAIIQKLTVEEISDAVNKLMTRRGGGYIDLENSDLLEKIAELRRKLIPKKGKQ